MDLETAQTNTTAKLPLLKQENGNSFKPTAQTTTNANGSSTTLIPCLVTANEKTQKKNNVKARNMLLMALLNEHLLTFNQYKDAKNLFAAIQTRFGGNDATKKTQKTLLKQMYENFSAPSTEFLDSIFNRRQKIVISTASTQVSTANLSDDTVYAFLASQPNGSQLVHEDLEQIYEDDLEEMNLKWQLALLSRRMRKFFLKTGRKITINGSDIAGYDKSKVECFNYHKLGHFARECRGPRNQDNRSRNQDSSRRTINVEEISSKVMLAIDGAGFDWIFMADEEVPTDIALMAFSDSEIPDKSRKGLSYNAVLPPPTRLFSPPNLDLSNSGLEEFQQPEFEGYGPKTSKSVSEDTSNDVRKYPDASLIEESQQQEKPVRKPVKYAEVYRLNAITIKGKGWNIVPRAVLMKTGLRPLNTARPVNTGHPKNTIYSARPMSFNTTKGKVNTTRTKAVNTARPNIAVVNAVRENQVNAVKGHPQKEDQGYVDSGCSRHMTGNMFYLSYFKEFDGGYELQFNLFNVSQMCDKKNSVLFIDTGSFVLSPNFKFADESQVLLIIPRKNNMYSVDMKNTIPKECLTCLVVKATLYESMLWHRRLGHVNLKTINKLVKDNFVKGLPIKRFKNDQTCVACLKGKQHKTSCKSKIQNSITQPLFMLHMDLFGPTFVSNLMNKKYCLVVTDDYSRFTWVFFLESKDETCGFLKSFITQIENLVDKKVKIIICDHGTEFKNRVMSEFCEKKGIKREFSVSRTPQQNGVAERRNRTLIEAAKTMLADSKLSTTFWAKAVNTACYVQNRVLVVKPHNKTLYELFRGRTPSLSFMKPFGCHVTILNTLDHLEKFNRKCKTPKIGSQRNVFPGALLHNTIAQVMRERPLSVV
ncbi:putative ribonuclease H-like domain-containing protein [Tanacetum coccineum]